MTFNIMSLLLVPLAVAASGRDAGTIAVKSEGLTITARPQALPIFSGRDALYQVTFHNVSKTDQLVDLASVEQVGISFFGQDSAALSSDIQTDNFFPNQRCRDPKGLAVIKPGAEVTVLIKIPTPRTVSGSVDLTLIVGFWVVTDLATCQSKRIETASDRMQAVEVSK